MSKDTWADEIEAKPGFNEAFERLEEVSPDATTPADAHGCFVAEWGDAEGLDPKSLGPLAVDLEEFGEFYVVTPRPLMYLKEEFEKVFRMEDDDA